MNKNLLAITISLLAGGMALAVVLFTREPAPLATPAANPGLHFDQSAGTEQRIRALEAAVAEERNARMLLEEELQALYLALDEISAGQSVAAARSDEGSAPERSREARQQRRPDDADSLRLRLVEAGLSEDRAAWILRRESELRMQSMQAAYEYRRTGERPEGFEQIRDPDRALRAEIGDVEYEQYLEASGYPTAVAVGSVLESSPGQRAGLQPGDQIVAYGGERVFSFSDLGERTMAAEPGQPVVVDFIRDGVPMQIVVDGGPIGISGGRYLRPGRR
ncbi:MAG: PDZ domain-containing protein [Woeseiaceae bacterium]|nr:PDZ domain-containing protein [Woeseiaceae bacterium]